MNGAGGRSGRPRGTGARPGLLRGCSLGPDPCVPPVRAGQSRVMPIRRAAATPSQEKTPSPEKTPAAAAEKG